MRYLYLLLLCSLSLLSPAQELYFPPIDESGDWETTSPESLGWCPEKVDSLIQFVEEKNSKSFIVLVDGKIVIEEYFDDHDDEAFWYWASAGKSLMGMLMGMAQEDGLINIEAPTSDYLGEGWTSCSSNEELAVKVKHQLSMASGFDDSVEPPASTNNCFEPECFECLVEPTTRWAYHNSAYRILQDVLETVSDQDKTIYTRTRLGNRIGMKGFWLNYVYYSNARDMARFGLLTLAQGNWNGDAVLFDMEYYNAMINPSQEVNPSYGYLWWLNGQSSYMIPTLQLSFDGSILPEAPQDMFAALGKNDQKVYVVPSQNMVVIRQGDSAGPVAAAASSFDNLLWERMADLACITAINDVDRKDFNIYPNPGNGQVNITSNEAFETLSLYNIQGRLLQQFPFQSGIQLNDLAKGIYLVQLKANGYIRTKRLIIQ